MYNAEKIKWVKSVRRNFGSDWAYEELECVKDGSDTSQKLHWRTDIGQKAASHPKLGEIILLFQTLNHGPHKGIVRLTHLVSPVSDKILADANNQAYKWYREVRLIAKAAPIYAIPKPEILKFGKVGNGGLTFGIDLLSNSKIDTLSVQYLIWDLFNGFHCPDSLGPFPNISSLIELDGQLEGDSEIRRHIELEIRNRNSKIIVEKKQEALTKGGGRIRCECCDFDFGVRYGQFANGFIECHHKIFLSEGQRITRLEDLALVCSNCHRMLHRRNLENRYYSVAELQDLKKGRGQKL